MNILNLDPFVDTREALEKAFGYWGWNSKERFKFKLESINSITMGIDAITWKGLSEQRQELGKEPKGPFSRMEEDWEGGRLIGELGRNYQTNQPGVSGNMGAVGAII